MQHKGVIELKPSNFQLINKPRITKSIFQVNKDYNFSTEVLLEIDKNTKVSETFGEEMAAIVVLSLEFFQGKAFKEIPFKLEMEIEGIFKWDEELEDNPSQLEVLLKAVSLNFVTLRIIHCPPLLSTTPLSGLCLR